MARKKICTNCANGQRLPEGRLEVRGAQVSVPGWLGVLDGSDDVLVWCCLDCGRTFKNPKIDELRQVQRRVQDLIQHRKLAESARRIRRRLT